MSNKVVSVSFINESIDFLEIDSTKSGEYSFSPSIATTNESLLAACKRADEIQVNGLFANAFYGWEVFPKVEERYLKSLVAKFVQRKNSSASLASRLRLVKEVVKDGTVSSLVACQALERSNIDSLLERLSKFKSKVKTIHTLPTALAAAVVESEKPSANFLLLWIKEDVSVISINSPEGLVKISRTLPGGLPDETLPDVGPASAANFSRDLSREIVMTVNYFKQKFREDPPADLYVLGESRLQRIIERHPLEKVEAVTHFGLTGKVSLGLPRENFNEKIHLLGNLYADETYNFLPYEEIVNRKTGRALSFALAVMALLICVALFWSVRLPEKTSNQALKNQVRELQTDVQNLQASTDKLQPVHGQKKFYKAAFLDEKPAFITILQQLSAIMPQQMIFNNFKMTPADDYWDCTITGEIKGQSWQERLDILREFGRSLYSFANVDVRNVVHSLGQTGMDSSTINFQITLQFLPGEQK